MPKYSFILARTETTSVVVEIDASNRHEGYDKAWDLLQDEDNPVDWDSGEVVHAEEDVLFD